METRNEIIIIAMPTPKGKKMTIMDMSGSCTHIQEGLNGPLDIRQMVENIDGGARLRYCPRLNSVSIMGMPHNANMRKYGIKNVA